MTSRMVLSLSPSRAAGAGAFRRMIAGSAVIRLSSLLGLASLNFLAPLLLGGADFGLATALLCVPFLFQAIADPVMSSLTIRSLRAPGGRESLGRLFRDSLAWAAAGALAAAGLCYYHLAVKQQAAPFPFAVGAGALLAMSIVTTQLFAVAYGLQRFTRIAGAYLAAAVGLIAGLAVFHRWGALGYLGSLLASQAGAQLVLLASPRVRRFAAEIARSALRHRPPRTIRASYLPALAPRLVSVLLTSGLLVAASLRYSRVELAEFKLTVSLILAFNFIIPVSPEVIQAIASRSRGMAFSGKRRLVVWMFAMTLAGALACYLGAGRIYRLLLGTEGAGDARLLFLGMPLFLLVSPVASYLFVMGQERRILVASTAAAAATAGAACFDPRVAFTAGAAVFLAVSAGMPGLPTSAAARLAANRDADPDAVDG